MDRHLNLFDFFNNHDYEYYEDNLSRGFALCLKYDTVLLDNVLRKILDSEAYSALFNTDYPDYQIKIDLQKRPSELENFSRIIAVACSGTEIDIPSIPKMTSRQTGNPETDLCIEINDTCIIFEFKRTYEDCTAQLKCQAEIIQNNCPEGTEVFYVDFNWRKIVKAMLNVLSLQNQINSENQFTIDFVRFIEKRHPDWFPNRLLVNISFPKTDEEPSNYYLNDRLNQLKEQIANKIGAETIEFSGKYYRLVISVNWNWANEIHISSYCDNNENYLTISVYPGDTKGQGWHLFKPNKKAIKWPTEIHGYELSVESYMKFSHFNSGLFWYVVDDREYEITHKRDFFENQAGRYQRKEHWKGFESLMDSISPDWCSKCEYDQKLSNTNRNYFDLSLGNMLTVYIPYKKAQALDNNEINSVLAEKMKELIISLKKLIDNN
jgi:hypothetical protein